MELYECLDPNNPDTNDYVFDNFKWDHCSDVTDAFNQHVSIDSQLYDLAADPSESSDVSQDRAYAESLSVIVNRAAAFLPNAVTPAIAEGYNDRRDTAWESASAVVPWLSDSTQRHVEHIFHNVHAPNIVFFLVDDWGINDPGYQSTYLSFTTPHIDALASKGIKLANYYSHELCVPSRAALMTGRYASRFGMQADNSDYELPLVEATLAEELKSAGYRTYLIGKWHLGFSAPSATPRYRGFDRFYGYLGDYIDPLTKKFGEYIDLHNDNDLVTSVDELSSSVHTAALFVKKTEDILIEHRASHSSDPMFLMLASSLMHAPWYAPDRFMERCAETSSSSSLYHDQVTYCALNILLDEVVANTSCLLDKYGMTSNTLFIMASDNGGAAAMAGSTYPYRGGKGSTFEGGIKVPAFVVGDMIPTELQGTSFSGILHVTGTVIVVAVCL